MRALILAAAAFAACAYHPAQAAELHYTATLNGHQEPTNTGSAATGWARIDVDTATQTVDAQIEIHGLRMSELAAHLAHAPMGPMHLHRYQGDDVTLILPFPMGSTYVETADGFTVTLRHYAYAEGAAIVRSGLELRPVPGRARPRSDLPQHSHRALWRRRDQRPLGSRHLIAAPA